LEIEFSLLRGNDFDNRSRSDKVTTVSLVAFFSFHWNTVYYCYTHCSNTDHTARSQWEQLAHSHLG